MITNKNATARITKSIAQPEAFFNCSQLSILQNKRCVTIFAIAYADNSAII